MSVVVTIYGRPGCHLCDQATAAIERIQAEGGTFQIEQIDIESDENLFRANLELIPVVMIQGARISELVFDEPAFRARLDTLV